MAAGLVYLVGRSLYFRTYVKDPGTRGPGMMLTFLANLTLVIGGLIGGVLAAI